MAAASALNSGRCHLQRIQRVAGVSIYAFLTVETSASGVPHIHALVGNVAHLRAFCGRLYSIEHQGKGCCLVHMWPYGHARVLPYNPQRGACYYVSKCVADGATEWDLVGFPAAPQITLASARPQIATAAEEMLKRGSVVTFAKSEPLTNLQAKSADFLDPTELLTPDELAKRLKVDQSWVYEQTRRRGTLTKDPLPCIRMGKYLRFYWPHVVEWLKRRETYCYTKTFDN